MDINRIKGWQLYDYYQWMLDKIKAYMEPYYNYSLLLHELHSIEFKWGIANDENRAIDGVNLRHEYMDEQNVPDIFYHDGVPCSVLEMLISLAIRCDGEIMYTPGANRTHEWFWMMIDNLGLLCCTDDNFNSDYVRQQIRIWLNREFKNNGAGSPFPLNHRIRNDQRKQTIWAQMCGYLSERF